MEKEVCGMRAYNDEKNKLKYHLVRLSRRCVRQAHARQIFSLRFTYIFFCCRSVFLLSAFIFCKLYILWWRRRKYICLFFMRSRSFISRSGAGLFFSFCLLPLRFVSLLPPATCRLAACQSFFFVNCVLSPHVCVCVFAHHFHSSSFFRQRCCCRCCFCWCRCRFSFKWQTMDASIYFKHAQNALVHITQCTSMNDRN